VIKVLLNWVILICFYSPGNQFSLRATKIIDFFKVSGDTGFEKNNSYFCPVSVADDALIWESGEIPEQSPLL
jgi:hypothetical protein